MNKERRNFLLGLFSGAVITASGGSLYLKLRDIRQPRTIDISCDSRDTMPNKHAEIDLFFSTLIPVSRASFWTLASDLLQDLKRLRGKNADTLNSALTIFGQRLERDFPGALSCNQEFGSHDDLRKSHYILVDILEDSSTRDAVNAGLDVFYQVISRNKRFGELLIGRKFSEPGKQCVYWENYDAPVNPASLVT